MQELTKMRSDCLSVIVPVYNAEAYLSRCVDSILNQTYSNLDIVLVDDGSSDNSGSLCDAYARKDQRVRAFHIPNSGPSAARNHGLLHCWGQYLAFVDSDDYLEPTLYAELIAQLQSSSAQMVVCGWINHWETDCTPEKTSIGEPGRYDAVLVKKTIMFDDNLFGGGYPWNRVINHAAVLEKTGQPILFPAGIHVYEDKWWNIDILSVIKTVAVSSASGYHYVIRESSLSRSSSPEKLKQALIVFRHMIDNLKEQDEWTQELEVKFQKRFPWWIRQLAQTDKQAAIAEWKIYRQLFANCPRSVKERIRDLFYGWELSM